MRPEPKYTGRPTRFWAHAKFISEKVGYGDRGTKRLRTYTPIQAIAALRDRALIPDNDLLADVLDYLNWRAQMLNEHVAGQFMDRAQAAVEFAKMRNRLPPTKSLPMNKQKGEKRHPAYLASMVAMTAESVFGPDGFVDDARKQIAARGRGSERAVQEATDEAIAEIDALLKAKYAHLGS